MKAIETKYYGPTNSKGSRIGVKAEGLPRQYVSWNYELDVYDNHLNAARVYAVGHDWLKNVNLIGGGTEKGYVFCMVPKTWKAGSGDL